MNFAEHLMTLRKQRGWSQEELGDQIGVTRQTVSKWELGQSTPELEKLIELSKLFHMSIDRLVGLEEDIAVGINEAQGAFYVLRRFHGGSTEQVWALVKEEFPHMWGWVRGVIQWVVN